MELLFDLIVDSPPKREVPVGTVTGPATFLNVPQPMIGPDGIRTRVEFQFVKPGKGVAFVRLFVPLITETRVRSDVVARWFLAWLAELPGKLRLDGSEIEREESALVRLIEERTRSLPEGRPSDPPGEQNDES